MRQLRLMVQGEPQELASGRRTGSQQQRHLAVVILNAVSLLRLDDSFSTSAAMAAIAGMALVAIDDGRGEAVIAWQCLVAFQACIDLANGLAQRASIHPGV
jgi:cystathionine beta-lyase/cystathionine gamma-synthase